MATLGTVQRVQTLVLLCARNARVWGTSRRDPWPRSVRSALDTRKPDATRVGVNARNVDERLRIDENE